MVRSTSIARLLFEECARSSPGRHAKVGGTGPRDTGTHAGDRSLSDASRRSSASQLHDESVSAQIHQQQKQRGMVSVRLRQTLRFEIVVESDWQFTELS